MAVRWEESAHELDSKEVFLLLRRRDGANQKIMNYIWYREHDERKWWAASAMVAIVWAIAIWLSCR